MKIIKTLVQIIYWISFVTFLCFALFSLPKESEKFVLNTLFIFILSIGWWAGYLTSSNSTPGKGFHGVPGKAKFGD